MNGIHDMGGMHGFGPITIEQNEPVFHAPWQGRVYALAMYTAAAVPGGFRYQVEQMPPQDYLNTSYYEKWLHARTAGSLVAGIIKANELAEKIAWFSQHPEQSATSRNDPDTVAKVMGKPPSISSRDANNPPSNFRHGETIRARNMHPTGHTRLPRYVRGKQGTIEHCYGLWPLDDTPPIAAAEPQMELLFRVKFTATELWGDDAEANQSLYIDLWDCYIEQ